jgi:hypothetical protein
VQKAALLVATLVINSIILFGQSIPVSLPVSARVSSEENFGMTPGCARLWLEKERLNNYFNNEFVLQEKARRMSDQSQTAWNFKVGDAKKWWTRDFALGRDVEVSSTCRAVGLNCYVFVEDALWNSRVNQGHVNAVVNAFDYSTPKSPSEGIYKIMTDTFGSPPNVDGDPKIIIFILDIRDDYRESGSGIAGYFNPIDQFPDGTVPGYRSNFAEIYYLDANPTELGVPTQLTFALAVLAHEFQHMIHFNYDRNEITFINEACSEVSMIVCGYPFYGEAEYPKDTNTNLLSWNGTAADYSRAARFMLYLWNQFPNSYLKILVQNSLSGIDGINAAFSAYTPTTPRRFDDVFKDWVTANYVNDLAYGSEFGYSYNNQTLTKPLPRKILNPNSSGDDFVAGLGVKYITFRNVSNFSISFSSYSLDISVRAILPQYKRVEDIVLNRAWSFSPNIDEITFVVVSNARSGFTSYHFSASGTPTNPLVEQKFDNGVGLGVLQGSFFSKGDTLAVYFDAIEGVRLDSVRIAFRRSGSMLGGINEYSGSIRPSPNGKPLVQPFVWTVTADTNSVPTTEATVKWVSKDLRAAGLTMDKAFVLWVVLGENLYAPGVLVAKAPHTGSPDHSYTYLVSYANWFYFTNQDQTEVFIYMMRAYGHIDTPTGVEVVEAVPSSFLLLQNYPNPFNPTTIIEFFLPERSAVKLSIVNSLGQEVETLLAEEKEPGKYKVEWNAGSLPSGVYLVRLETKSFRAAKKMLLIK